MVNPETVIGEVLARPVIEPGLEVARYEMVGPPKLEVVAVNETEAVVEVAEVALPIVTVDSGRANTFPTLGDTRLTAIGYAAIP